MQKLLYFFSCKHVSAGNFTASVGVLIYSCLFACASVIWHNVQIKKNIILCISVMFNTEGIFHLPFRHWYTEFVCRRAALWIGFMGGMLLFSKLWKTSHFMKKPQTPWEAERLSFQNWTASVHFSWKIFKEPPDLECWCLRSPVKENTPSPHLFKRWIIVYISEYSRWGGLLTTLFLCPVRNYELRPNFSFTKSR